MSAGRKDNMIAFSDQGGTIGSMGRSTTKRVWFLVVPRTALLDVAGPWEVLGHANDVLGRAAYDLSLIGTRAPAAETRYGLVLSGLRPLPTGARAWAGAGA